MPTPRRSERTASRVKRIRPASRRHSSDTSDIAPRRGDHFAPIRAAAISPVTGRRAPVRSSRPTSRPGRRSGIRTDAKKVRFSARRTQGTACAQRADSVAETALHERLRRIGVSGEAGLTASAHATVGVATASCLGRGGALCQRDNSIQRGHAPPRRICEARCRAARSRRPPARFQQGALCSSTERRPSFSACGYSRVIISPRAPGGRRGIACGVVCGERGGGMIAARSYRSRPGVRVQREGVA